MKQIIAFIIAITAVFAASAQGFGLRGSQSAATWSSRVEMTGKNTGKLVVTVTPAKGWHIYGFEVGEGGPRAMKADFSKSTGVKFKGVLKPSVAPVKTHDDIFDIDVTYWDGKVTFTREFTVTDRANAKVAGLIEYQGCNGETCNAPQKYSINLALPETNTTSTK